MDRFMTLIETVMKLTVYNMFVAAVLLGLIKDLKNYDYDKGSDSLMYHISRLALIGFDLTVLFGLLINIWVNLRSMYYFNFN